MKLIHMQTTITTVFGVDDGEGNAITQQPITVNVSVFKPEAFTEAYTAIANARDQAVANSESVESPIEESSKSKDEKVRDPGRKD